jgi:hypothetical protein
MADDVDGERGSGSSNTQRQSSRTSPPNPLVLKPEDVDFTYGSKWKQRYWKKQGDDYYVLPAQWTFATRCGVPTSSLGPIGGLSITGRAGGPPTGPLCDDCHSVNTTSRRTP